MVPGSMSGAGGRDTAEAWLWEDFADSCLNGYLVAARRADERNWPSVRTAYFNAVPALVRAVLPGSASSSRAGRRSWRTSIASTRAPAPGRRR